MPERTLSAKLPLVTDDVGQVAGQQAEVGLAVPRLRIGHDLDAHQTGAAWAPPSTGGQSLGAVGLGEAAGAQGLLDAVLLQAERIGDRLADPQHRTRHVGPLAGMDPERIRARVTPNTPVADPVDYFAPVRDAIEAAFASLTGAK